MRAEPLIVCSIQERDGHIGYQLNRNLFTNHRYRVILVCEEDLYIYSSKDFVLESKCDTIFVL